jgi:hypothetical protein
MRVNLAFLGAFVVLGAITTASAQQTDRPTTVTPGPTSNAGTGVSGLYNQGMGTMYPGAVVTATDRYVFVLRGDTLYKFDAGNLRLLAQAQVPASGMNSGGAGASGASGATGTTGSGAGTTGNPTGTGTPRP